MTESKTVREPLFHVVKRGSITVKKQLLIYAISIFAALLITSIFCVVSSEDESNPFAMFSAMFNGVFGTERRIWLFLRDTALLLGVSLAIVPAFKMKFWNLGANGQILISCFVCTACMFNLGGKISDGLLMPIMIVLSIAAGVIWAVIPAVFKAIFKTNESLFTLMMNYIAEGIVVVAITVWAPTGSGTLSPISDGEIPNLINPYLLTIIVVALITVFMTFYLNKSKHGYELSVVGESVNTARYVGINVKKVIIRTLALSGALCGIIGLILSGHINHTVNSTMHSNMGFTAIMTAWLAKFNPLVLIGTSALITFISQGMGQVRKDFGFYNDAIANVVLGIIYFFIIGCEFFIRYQLVFRKKAKTENTNGDFMATVKEKRETKSASSDNKREDN